MSKGSIRPKRKVTHNNDIPPLRPNTFSMRVIENEIHLSFGWVPPEKKDDIYILNRSAISDKMAKLIAERILQYLDDKNKKA